MNTKNFSAFFLHPLVEAISTYLQEVDIKIPTLALLDSFYNIKGESYLSFIYIKEVFSNIGITIEVFSLDFDNLKVLDCPLIVGLQNINTNSKLTEYSVIKKINSKSIYYIKKDKSLTNVSVSSFKKMWTGILLFIEFDITSLEVLYDKYLKVENLVKKSYKDQIYIYDKFLSRESCNDIIDYIESKNVFIKSRLNFIRQRDESIFLVGVILERYNPVFFKIYLMISVFLKLPIDSIENIICLKIKKGKNRESLLCDDITIRKHTIIVFLNESSYEGDFTFVELDFRIQARVGNAIIFSNKSDTNNLNIYSLIRDNSFSNIDKYVFYIGIK